MAMANPDDKRTPGQRIQGVRADTWNSMVAAGDQYRMTRMGQGGAEKTRPRETAIIKCRNETGGDRAIGEVVCFNGLVVSDSELSPSAMWVIAVETRRGGRFGILKYSTQEYESGTQSGMGEVQVSGVTLARVNVTNTSHRAARLPDDGTFVLQSSFAGPVSVIWSPDETGEADCIVRLRGDSLPVFKTPAGGIDARDGTTCSSAECVPYYLDDDGELTELNDDGGTSQTVEIFNIFGTDIGASVYITAKDLHGVLVVDSEDCS